MKLLHIDSSPIGASSASRQLSRLTVAEWTARHSASVEYLDLTADAIPHLDLSTHDGDAHPDAARQQREAQRSETLVTQFLAADLVVIGVPMINFGIPSQLKAWIDRIAQAGRTFRYTDSGAEGLASGKKIILVSTRGGVYSTPAQAAMEHQESYLKAVFGFLGVNDVTIVRAEGLKMGPRQKEQGLALGRHAIDELVGAADGV